MDKHAQYNNPNLPVSGNGISELISTIHSLYDKGAPTEYDNQGFNKIHYGMLNEFLSYSPSDAIPLHLAVRGIGVLKTYSKTQVLGYDALKKMVEDDISKAVGISTQSSDAGSAGPNAIQFVGNGAYGKLVFKVPGKIRKIGDLNLLIGDRMAELGFRREYDNYGRLGYSVWKMFSKSRVSPDSYDIHPNVIEVVANYLQDQGYDTSSMRSYASSSSESSSDKGTSPTTAKIVATLQNNVLAIDFGGYYPSAIATIKTLTHKRNCNEDAGQQCFDFNPSTKAWFIINPIKSLVELIISSAKRDNPSVDASELESILSSLAENSEYVDSNDGATGDNSLMKWSLRDISQSTNGKWHISVKFLNKRHPGADKLKEILKLCFVQYVDSIDNETGNRALERKDGSMVVSTYLRGDYRDYIDFYTSMRNSGFDVSELQSIISSLIKNGYVKKTRRPGDLDGYKSIDSFNKDLETYEKNAGIKLYDLQKEDIAYVYSRNNALIGNETGTGKTITTVAAVDLRMKKEGGIAVVITKLPVVAQFSKEIARITGISENEVSNDPLNLKKWIVLSYNDFQTKSKRDLYTDMLSKLAQSGAIKYLILDEVHSVKNSSMSNYAENKDGTVKRDPKTGRRMHKGNHGTFNIQELAQHIPFVYGASATIVANKPIDVYNQLKAIGHKLGKMSRSKFAREFAGMRMGRFGMEDGTPEEQFEAAQRLKEALVDQRVYIQRTKKDMRGDMPDQNILIADAGFDAAKKNALIQSTLTRLETYKDPELPITAMQAFRATVAEMKAPITADMAAKVLDKGERVAVFTDYNEPKNIIVNRLQKHLNDTSGGRVLYISGGMKKGEREQVVADFKKENSDVKALVINFVAGGTGLDFPNTLTEVYNNDFDWSVALDEQALGRFYRINSKKDVNVHYVVANGTTDERYYQRLQFKKEIADLIRNLTQEQMALIMNGHRRGKSNELQKVEAELFKAQQEMDTLERSDEAANREAMGELWRNLHETKESSKEEYI